MPYLASASSRASWRRSQTMASAPNSCITRTRFLPQYPEPTTAIFRFIDLLPMREECGDGVDNRRQVVRRQFGIDRQRNHPGTRLLSLGEITCSVIEMGKCSLRVQRVGIIDLR